MHKLGVQCIALNESLNSIASEGDIYEKFAYFKSSNQKL